MLLPAAPPSLAPKLPQQVLPLRPSSG